MSDLSDLSDILYSGDLLVLRESVHQVIQCDISLQDHLYMISII